MKQYDSYIILGCHFPVGCIKLIMENSTLKYFNSKIKISHNCEILEVETPLTDDKTYKTYYLKINIEQSEQSIIKLDKLDYDKNKYRALLEIFDMEYMGPYLISIPVVRDLPNYK